MAAAVRRNERSISINLIAVERRLKKGTLSAADRRTVERMLPGFLDKILPKAQLDRLQEGLMHGSERD